MPNIFPKNFNLIPIKILAGGFVFLTVVVALVTYYATPKSQYVGYQPEQPIPFDHSIHAGQLGMDCRYCHSFVEKSGHANIPSANTCWNCHSQVKRDSVKLEPLRRAIDKSYEHYDGKPIEWVKVHNSPDYVYFNHSAHLNRGISCQSCHGQINEMRVVYQDKPLSMAFCLECHRAPEKHLRPLEEVFNLNYDPKKFIEKHPELGVKTPEELGRLLKKKWSIKPKESCFACHR